MDCGTVSKHEDKPINVWCMLRMPTTAASASIIRTRRRRNRQH